MNRMGVFLPGPEVVHFHSWVTGVSFELPVGFAFEQEDESSATYVDEDEEGPAARVQVRVVGKLEGNPNVAVERLAEAFAERGDSVTEDRPRGIDGIRAIIVATLRDDGWYLHQTVFAADDRLLTIVAMIPPERAEALAPALDTAIDSVRVISP